MTTRILLIEDDDVFRKRLAKALNSRGFEVFQASNATQAFENCRMLKPERAVLDLRLGEESGLDILRRLIELSPSIKVVVLTGYGTISTTVEALKIGAVNYLTKPVDADAVLDAFEPESPIRKKTLPTPGLAQIEWDHIQKVIDDCDGNISHASKALGLHRRSLQRKLVKPPSKLK